MGFKETVVFVFQVGSELPEVIPHYTSMEQSTSGGQLSNVQVEDLLGMIRNAEKSMASFYYNSPTISLVPDFSLPMLS